MKKILTLLFLLFSLPAYAVTATFQEGVSGYSGTRDVYMYHVGDTNRDTQGLILPYAFSPNHIKRNIIKFDLASITGTVDVTSASLDIRIKSGLSNDNCVTHVRRLLRDWGETTATSATYDGSNAWGWEDASGEGTDITATDDGSNTRTSITAPVTITVTGLDALVEGWINGTYPNYGMVVYSDAEGDAEGIAGDSEDATSSNRPLLTIEYTTVESGNGGNFWYGTLSGTLN